MSTYGIRQLADSMRAVRENTILIAGDIPESKYAFRATPETRSVAETLVHIAWLTAVAFTLANAGVLTVRLRAERRALREAVGTSTGSAVRA